MSFFLRSLSTLALALLMLSGSLTFAETEKGDEPEDATVYNPPKAAALVVGEDADDPKSAGLVSEEGFYSKKLRGSFLGKTMRVTIGGNANGTTYVFWGARAVELDADSPLRKMGMVEGDVISRLDGLYLDRGKFLKGNIWQMPELDNHFGVTEVRWIKQGTAQVNVDKILLDSKGNNANPGNAGNPPPEAP